VAERKEFDQWANLARSPTVGMARGMTQRKYGDVSFPAILPLFLFTFAF
jgi:hypothetical protein